MLFIINPLHYIANPKKLIEDSRQFTRAIGSTTVCLMTLDDNKLILRTAKVGNSGYAIYRLKGEEFQLVF